MSLPQPPKPTDAPGPVPADNQPGHHPSKEQDKPDLTAFAQKLGVTEPTPDAAAGDEGRPRASKAVAVAVAAAVALLGLLGLVVTRKRRARRR